MRLNPPKKKSKKGLVVGLALATGAFLLSRRSRAAGGRRGLNGCSTAPFTWRPDAYRAAVQSQRAIAIAQASAGQPIPSNIDVAATAARAMYPEGDWPPSPNSPANEKCLWDKMIVVAQDVLGPEINWPAIVNPLVNFGKDAQPGRLLQIEGPNKPPSFWSHSAIASKPGILDVILKNAGVPNTKSNRFDLYDAIVCSPWNDALLTTPGPEGGTGTGLYKPPHGRGISMLPIHADNLQLMLSGRPPRRRATSGKSPGGGRLPLIWIPDIVRGSPAVVVKTYPDGRSAINPPAEILELGLDNVNPGSYGCDPWRQNAAPLQY